MKLLSTLALVTALGVSTFSFTANAGPMGGQLEHSARLLLSDKGQKLLELTEAQQDQLKTIYADYKTAKKALKESGKEAHSTYREEMKALMQPQPLIRFKRNFYWKKAKIKSKRGRYFQWKLVTKYSMY